MDYVIEHANGHKYIKRWWKNGHWNYEYKNTNPHLEMAITSNKAKRSQMSTYDKGYQDGKSGRDLKKASTNLEKRSAFSAAQARSAKKFSNQSEGLIKEYWTGREEELNNQSALYYQKAVDIYKENWNFWNTDAYKKGYKRGVRAAKRENSKVYKTVNKAYSKISSSVVSTGKSFVNKLKGK